MREFVSKSINEQQLLEKTEPGLKYDALYLCSALVLPEERGKGLAMRLLNQSIKSIRKQHPIKFLFYWGFSVEGKKLADAAAKECSLPLFARKA